MRKFCDGSRVTEWRSKAPASARWISSVPSHAATRVHAAMWTSWSSSTARWASFTSSGSSAGWKRLLRHRDVKTTTGTYGHLVVEDLRDAINLLPPSPFAASLLQDPGSRRPGVQNSTLELSENQQLGMERETGVEPATLSLGS